MPPDLRESITAASLREDVLVEPVDALVQKSVVLWRKASDIDEDGNDWERLVTLAKDAGVPLDEKAMMELVPPPREQPSTAAGRGGIESIESLGANVRLMNMKPEVMDKLQKMLINKKGRKTINALQREEMFRIETVFETMKEKGQLVDLYAGDVNSDKEVILIPNMHLGQTMSRSNFEEACEWTHFEYCLLHKFDLNGIRSGVFFEGDQFEHKMERVICTKLSNSPELYPPQGQPY